MYDLATHFSVGEFDVAVAGGGNGMLFDKLEEKSIHTVRIPTLERDVNIIKELKSFFYILKIIKKERPDIIHLNSTKMGVIGGIAGFLLKISAPRRRMLIIFTVHGWGFCEERVIFMKFFLYALAVFSSLFHDRTIVLSAHDKRAGKKFIAPRKLSLIPLGIRQINFLPQRAALKELEQITKQTFPDTLWIAGTIAELTKNKGLEYLIDAAQRIDQHTPNSKLRVIIMGDGEERERLSKKVNAMGLENKVFFAGFVPDGARFIRAFDVFVLPSLKEGLPYVILEAKAAGVPVIASAVGGIPDLVSPEEDDFLVPPKDSEMLAQSLLAFFSEKKAKELRPAQERYTKATPSLFRAMIQATLELYRKN